MGFEIDRKAPLRSSAWIFIAAPPGRVFEALRDIDSWPSWQPSVSSASLEGRIGKGATFRWKAGGMAIRSRIEQYEPGRLIAWSGSSVGLRARHRWVVEAEKGGSRARTEESLSGWLASLLALIAPRFLDDSLAQSVRALKARCEKENI